MPRRRVSAEGEVPSALRQARLARNWTLEEVAEEIDLRTCPFRAYSLVTGADLAISNGHRLNAPTSPQVGPHP